MGILAQAWFIARTAETPGLHRACGARGYGTERWSRSRVR